MDGTFSYAEMVKARSSVRFDPMLEEARGSYPQTGVAKQNDSEAVVKADLADTEAAAGGPH